MRLTMRDLQKIVNNATAEEKLLANPQTETKKVFGKKKLPTKIRQNYYNRTPKVLFFLKLCA